MATRLQVQITGKKDNFMNNAVTVTQSRLPMPKSISEEDAGKWRVLCESIFPTAKTAEAIMLALDYCKARKLDVMKKPVNIVPMWSNELKRYVETVWPGINSVQIDAARSNSWAGMDEPKWGKDVTRTFKGVKKDNVGDSEVTITFPESCTVTVYRIVQGQRYAFAEPVYWLECYARIGKTELPNDMWAKRTRGQFLKVAKAFSLRAAFPEDADYTAEEMEGRTIEEVDSHNGVIIENQPKSTKSPFKNNSLRNSWVNGIIDTLNKAEFKQDIYSILLEYQEKCDELIASGNQHDALAVESIKSNAQIIMKKLPNKPASEGSQADINAMRGMPPEDDDPNWVTDEPLELEEVVVRNNAAIAAQVVPGFLRKPAA